MKYILSRECFIAHCLTTAPHVELACKCAVLHPFTSDFIPVKGKRGREEVMLGVWYLLLFFMKFLSPRTLFAHLNWQCSSETQKNYHNSNESLLMDIRCFSGV